MPETLFFGRRPPVPLCGKKIDIIVGEPIEFDMASLKQAASMVPHDSSSERKGWPTITPDGLDEAAQRWLYQKMSDKIQSAMEGLRKRLLNQSQHWFYFLFFIYQAMEGFCWFFCDYLWLGFINKVHIFLFVTPMGQWANGRHTCQNYERKRLG